MKTFRPIALMSLVIMATAVPVCAQVNWEHTQGPEGGASWHIVSNADYFFYADEYYLYRSEDGMAWEQLPEPDIFRMTGYHQSLVAQQTLHSDAVSYSGRLIVSHDNGETWVEGTMPGNVTFLTSAVMCSHGIYVPRGQEHIIYHSTDDAQTWEVIDPPFDYGYDLESFEDRLYLRSSTQIWRTDSNGENWADITPPLSTQDYIKAIAATGDHITIVSTDHVWYSHDDGQSWNSHYFEWPSDFHDLVYANNTLYAIGGPTRLSISYDFGETLNHIDVGETYFNDIVSLGDMFLGCTYDRGVFAWNNASQEIIPAINGLYSAAVYTLIPSEERMWAVCGNGLFVLNTSTGIWSSKLPRPEYDNWNVATGPDGLVFANNNHDTLYISHDHGDTWEKKHYTYHPIGLQRHEMQYSDGVLVLGRMDIMKTEDFGTTWQFPPIPVWSFGGMRSFQDQFYIAGTSLTDLQDQLFHSMDGGDTWEYVQEFPGKDVWDMFSAGERLFLMCTTDDFVATLYASDNGIDWYYANTGLPEYEIQDPSLGNSGSIVYNHGVYVLRLPSKGLFASMDSGHTWVPIERQSYNAIAVLDGMYYAGGFGGGVVQSDDAMYGALMAGKVYLDDNENGVQDGAEADFPDVQVGLTTLAGENPFYFTTTNHLGEYALGVFLSSQDTLRPFIHSDYISSINPPYYLADNPGTDRNFGVTFIPGIFDLAVYAGMGFGRPGYEFTHHVYYRNAGTEAQDAMVSVSMDTSVEFISATPPPSEILGDSLVWHAGQLDMLDADDIRIRFYVPVHVPIGTPVTQVSRISSANTDETPTDNVHSITKHVVGAYDPNYKEVSPADGLTEQEILDGKEVFYTIHFQNTGNYPADRVRITDQLDTALYLPSIRLIAASHTISALELHPGGLLSIIFDEINLPDSISNEPESHGFVTFAIQRKHAFSRTEPVLNKAAIFFDFNDPIITNEVAFTLREDETSSIPHLQDRILLQVFPNPAKDIAYVSVPEEFVHESLQLTVFDVEGKCILQRDDPGANSIIKLRLENPGIYFVQLRNNTQSAVGKVIIE